MADTKLGPFVVHFQHSEEFHNLKSEIFTHNTYYFESDTPHPLIIDAGAHIGLATLYFKKLYPAARIIAIEPQPDNFALLEKNVFENNLDDVELLNTALATSDDLVELHVDASDEGWFSTASLQPSAWNGQQHTKPMTVPALTLTTLLSQIDEPVTLLKMDIESAELAVLRQAQDQLTKIKQIIMEFHPTSQQNITDMIDLLQESGFTVEQNPHTITNLYMITALRKNK